MPIEIPDTIINIIGGIFIAWFSYRGFHSYAIIREKRTNLKNSAIELINAFKPELEELKSLEAWYLGGTQNILLGAYDKHSKAALEFISHLEGTERTKFREAWERYKGDQEYEKSGAIFSLSEKEKKFMQYIAQSTEQENRDIAIKNIKHLLSFIKI